MGRVLQFGLSGGLKELASSIREDVSSAGLVLIRDQSLSEEQFKEFITTLRSTVQHKHKSGQSDLMKLDATREKEKVVVNRGPLPLHTDGILLGTHLDLIILYASEFSNLPGRAIP